MSRVLMLVLACMLAFSAQASGKKRHVHLRASSGCIFNLNRSHRSAARILVDVSQDDDLLYAQLLSGVVATISFLDEEGVVLAQQTVSGTSESMEIPDGAVTVVVSYGDVSFEGDLS